MTRDEAVELAYGAARKSQPYWDKSTVEAIVDVNIALGLLKLDEPEQKDYAADLVVEMQAAGHAVSLRTVERALAAAGLKIVEA